MSMYLIDIAVFLSVMGGIFLYLVKAPVRYKKYTNWKHVPLPDGVSFSALEAKVRLMVQTSLLSSAGTAEGLLYFKEKPSLYSWGNSYVIRQDDDQQHCTLYYRGSLIKWRTDKTNLNNMVFSLENPDPCDA